MLTYQHYMRVKGLICRIIQENKTKDRKKILKRNNTYNSAAPT